MLDILQSAVNDGVDSVFGGARHLVAHLLVQFLPDLHFLLLFGPNLVVNLTRNLLGRDIL